jgi:hypothetical protein
VAVSVRSPTVTPATTTLQAPVVGSAIVEATRSSPRSTRTVAPGSAVPLTVTAVEAVASATVTTAPGVGCSTVSSSPTTISKAVRTGVEVVPATACDAVTW